MPSPALTLKLPNTTAEPGCLKSEAAAICRALSGASLQVVVFDEQLRVLSTSLRSGEELDGAVQVGTDVRLGMAPDLVSALFPLKFGERRSTEFNGRPWSRCTAADGAWAIECVPWAEESDSSTEAPPKLQGGLLLLHQDAERHALRTRLKKENRFEALGRIAASVAHDFNNLLTGIRGSLALASQCVGSERSNAALAAADGAAARAGELTRELLHFEGGHQRQDLQTELRSVVQEAVALVRCLPDGPRVNVDLAADVGLAGIAPGHLHQVVMNLLMNARQATVRIAESGERCAEIEVSARVESGLTGPSGADSNASWVVLQVKDNGTGMDAQTQRRLFEPFYTTNQGRESTGLGLATVKQLVEKVGGWVEFESRPAVGSCFRVHLPRATNRWVKQGSTKSAVGLTVLICDDESRLATLTAGLLQEFGYQAATVATGEDAVNVLERVVVPIHVLLLDVNLVGDFSASDVLAALDDQQARLPVILTSGLAEHDVPQALMEHRRVSGYLGKPYTVDELTEAIDRAVKSASMRPL